MDQKGKCSINKPETQFLEISVTNKSEADAGQPLSDI
jgi:hypothetical protein